jgi:hypothetical protein
VRACRKKKRSRLDEIGTTGVGAAIPRPARMRQLEALRVWHQLTTEHGCSLLPLLGERSCAPARSARSRSSL